MPPFEKIQEYVSSVCEQVRWKKAHPVVSEELENHLIDQRDAYMVEGTDVSTATEKAIVQMGDPVLVGTQLDRTHRPKSQWDMIVLTVVLVAVGLVIKIFTMGIGDFDKPVFAAAVGLILMAAAYFTDFTLIGKFPKLTYFFTLALSAATLIYSPMINGRRFYAGLIPPLLFPLGFAAVVYAARNIGYKGIILCQAALFIMMFVNILTPTATGLLLTAVSGWIILTAAIYKGWFKVKKFYGYLLTFIPPIIFVLLVLTNMPHYYWLRLQIALNPALDSTGAGYFSLMMRALLDGSVIFGRGSMPVEYSMLTMSEMFFQTDYLLTYLIFRFGWIAFIMIIGLLLFFIVRGFMLSFKQKSVLGSLISVSVMLTFAMQVLSYVLFNLGLQFSAPISLPLISYGDTAAVINLVLIGLMLSVFRIGDMVKDKAVTHSGDDSMIQWNDGKLIISFIRK
ncbi:MAG: FtsW/RodA/SpoVE family cell cycle protein [Clostridia bacterium]|nr:FtsW/RodA/SpoVE family cell cycle protein [Clostridia bacterium]